jgi:hypothetical protein
MVNLKRLTAVSGLAPPEAQPGTGRGPDQWPFRDRGERRRAGQHRTRRHRRQARQSLRLQPNRGAWWPAAATVPRVVACVSCVPNAGTGPGGPTWTGTRDRHPSRETSQVNFTSDTHRPPATLC